jgi:hypothetical protein
MAKITYSPLIADIRGSAGGATFAAWKGRGYVRSKVKPSNPNTTAQQTVRDSMARLSPQWRSLPANVKLTADVYAGRDSKSGWNWFVSANRVLEETYATEHLTPPSSVRDPVTGPGASDGGGGSTTVTWTAPDDAAAGIYVDIFSRDVTDGSESNEWVRYDDGETTLASAETATLSLTANHDYQIVIIVHKPDEDAGPALYSYGAGTTISLGA